MWPGVTDGPKEQGTDTIGSEKRKVGYREAPRQRKENIESIIEQGRPFDLSEVKCACEDLTNLMNVFSDRRTIKICRGRRRLIPKKRKTKLEPFRLARRSGALDHPKNKMSLVYGRTGIQRK